MQIGQEKWKPVSWHCVNCGNIVAGFKNEKGVIKVECHRCKAIMVRKVMSPKRDRFDVFAPEEQRHI